MKNSTYILPLFLLGFAGCDGTSGREGSKIVKPEGSGSIEVEIVGEDEHPADQRACDEWGETDTMWYPNTSIHADIYVFMRPDERLWNWVFSGTVWVPIYVAAEHPVLLYFDGPQALNRVYQSDVATPSVPLEPEEWVALDIPEIVPVPKCPELYRLELPAEGDLFLLELEDVGDSIWAKVVPK